MVGVEPGPWTTCSRPCAARRRSPVSRRAIFEGVLDMLSGRYPSDEFAELRPRLTWDRIAGTLTARQGAQARRHRQRRHHPRPRALRRLPRGRAAGAARVGELDEEMVFESRVGETFVLGASTWRIEEITHDRVLVSPAPGEPGKMPFWKGDRPGRPAGAGARDRAAGPRAARHAARGARRAPRRSDHDLDTTAAENLLRYLADQEQAAQAVPDDRTVVIERCRDELGDWRVCVLAPFGSQVLAPWAMAAEARIRERAGHRRRDDVVRRRVRGAVPGHRRAAGPGAAAAAAGRGRARCCCAQLGGTALFAARFREVAARALLLPRRRPGARTPLWQQRKRAVGSARGRGAVRIVPDAARDLPRVPARRVRRSGARRRAVARRQPRRARRHRGHRQPVAVRLVAALRLHRQLPLRRRRAAGGAARAGAARRPGAAPRPARRHRAARAARPGGPGRGGAAAPAPRPGIPGADRRRRARPAAAPRRPHARRAPRARQSDAVAPDRAGAGEGAAGRRCSRCGRERGSSPSRTSAGIATRWACRCRRACRRRCSSRSPTRCATSCCGSRGRTGRSRPTLSRRGSVSRRRPPRRRWRGSQSGGRVRPGRVPPRGAAVASGARPTCCARSASARSRGCAGRSSRSRGTLGRFVATWHGLTVRRRRASTRCSTSSSSCRARRSWRRCSSARSCPARLDGYRPADLDVLAAAGEIVWVGIEALGERDGRVALYLADHLPKLLPARAPATDLPDRARRSSSTSRRRARRSSPAIHAACGGGYPGETVDALWDLAWRGLVTNDTFHALRAFTVPPPRSASGASEAPAFRSRRMTPPRRRGPVVAR